MIESFKHKGLKDFHEKNDRRKLNPALVNKLRDILTVLDEVTGPQDMDQDMFGLHPLKGDRQGTWSVWVNKNYRVTFRFENENVYDVNLEDYH
jgi:proteic killer suppression protein